MTHRVGVCGSCRARFQIPATFLPNRARCRACGGVVEIGPAEAIEETATVRTEPPPSPPHAAPAPVAPDFPAPEPEPEPESEAEPEPEPEPEAEAVAEAEPASEPEPKRSLLVPALVAAGVLALLVFGAFQLLVKSKGPSTAQAPAPAAPAASDGEHAGDPKPDETPAPR